MTDNQQEKFITEVINRIKSKAIDKKMSLSKLAKEIKMTNAGFYKMLDKASLQVITLKKIAIVLETSCADLLGEDVKSTEDFKSLSEWALMKDMIEQQKQMIEILKSANK